MEILYDSDLDELNVRPRSRAQRWRLIKGGKFPYPFKMGAKNAWTREQIEKYVADQIAAADASRNTRRLTQV